MTDYKWKHIEPLSDEERSIDLAAIQPLYESWRMAREKLSETSSNSLRMFMDKRVRSLSIETGIIEQVYDLDRGTTEALVAKGFIEDLVTRSSTDLDPARLIDILRDQEAAIQLVMDCVADNRSLSKGVIHDLHSILTAHQETTTAMDQFGVHMEIPLLRGAYKQQPNNPKRPDDTQHEYCPPVHVDAEMENLLNWYSDYSKEDPIIVASWLHHRFTQIHPYQDGNGRVGRALVSLVLLRSELLLPVIDRDLRGKYIDALESADAGDLKNLCLLFAGLERTAILQALSIDTDAEAKRDLSITKSVIENLSAKFDRRKKIKDMELRRVNSLAMCLRSRTRGIVEKAVTALKGAVSTIAVPTIHILEGGPENQKSHWYKYDVIESGKSSGKFINFSEDHLFIRAKIEVGTERLLLVASFHHVGRELSGIMEATTFARLESVESPEDGEFALQQFFPCALEPFVFAWRTKEEDIQKSYDSWLDQSIAVAIKEFGDRL